MRTWLKWRAAIREYKRYPVWVIDVGDAEPRRLTWLEALKKGMIVPKDMNR